MPVENPPVSPTETPVTSAATGVTETPALPRTEASPETPPVESSEEAREKIAKMEGFWNRISPEKKKETKPAATETKTGEGETNAPKPETKKGTTKGEAPAPEPSPEPEKPKRRKREAEIDPIQIAEATGRAIATEMAKTKPAEPSAQPKEVEPELPEEFKDDLAIFEEMARQDPKRYGSIKKDLAKYAAAEDQYIAKWEAEHPDESFDGDSEEHNEFYKRIKPDYSEKDFEKAKTSLSEQRAVERAKKEAREEFQKEYETREQRRERAEQIRPELEREMVGLMGEMIKEADPAHADLAKDWASIQSLDEKNPLLADVMVMVHEQTKPLIEANMRLFRNIDKPDPNNQAHQQVFHVIAEAEQAVQRLPPKERYDDEGRLFATQEEYSGMTPAERARHWYVGEAEAAAVIRGRAKTQTKAIYERESKRIARYTNGMPATGKPHVPSSGQPSKTDQQSTTTRQETNSPSVTGRATLPGDGQTAPKTPSNGKDWFFSRYLNA